MYDYKMDALLSTIISFGKHQGKTYELVRNTDVSYCNWTLKQMNTRGKMLEFQRWLRGNARKVTCECCNGTGLVDQL
jgi:hypothetical protein